MRDSSDDDKKIATVLKKSIQDFIEDVNHNTNFLAELTKDVETKVLQKLVSQKIFQLYLDNRFEGAVKLIFYFEVCVFVVLLACFSAFTYHAKYTSFKDFDTSKLVVLVVTVILTLYTIIREGIQLFAMRKIHLALNYFKDPWNYVDVLSSFGTLALVIYFLAKGNGSSYNQFAAIVALLMWIRALGVMKAISQQTATFVAMLTTIVYDLG